MTVEQFAQIVDACPTGRGKYRACCPAHEDTHASLDIATGSDGRILLICRSQGCSAAAIVQALGLKLRDLFPNTKPLSAEEGARLREERRAKEAAERRRARLERAIAERERVLYRVADSLLEKLVRLEDGPEADEISRLWHATLAKAREAEGEWHALSAVEPLDAERELPRCPQCNWKPFWFCCRKCGFYSLTDSIPKRFAA